MKRKFIILSFILYAFCQVLFLACNQKKETNKPAITPNVHEKLQQPEIKTRLVINNQSSAIVKAFKYSGKSLSAGEDVKIPIGEKAEIFLDDDSLSYVFFSLIDSVREKVIKVRTADVIAVKKDETKTFTILDSTTVLPIGVDENKLCTIFGILHPATLKLMNNTFANISDISFGGKMHKETVRPGNSWDVEFNSEVSGKLSFKLWDATNKATEVILRDEVTIKNDEVREVILKNDTLVLKGEKVEAIKTVLGISVLTIVNTTSAEISNLKLGEHTREVGLQKNESWEIAVFNDIDAVLGFDVNVKSKKFKVKCEEKINCAKGETKSFRITDEMLVKIEGEEKALKLGDLVNASVLTIANQTSVLLDDVSFAGCDTGAITSNAKKELFIFDFSNVPDYIGLTFRKSPSLPLMKFKTAEKISIEKKQEKTYIFKDDVLIVKEGVDAPYTIEDITQEKARLKIENRTSINLIDVEFGGKEFSRYDEVEDKYLLKVSAEAEEVFASAKEESIKFEAYGSKAETQDKIKLELGQRVGYSFNDDTQVLPEGHTQAIKLRELFDAGSLTIENVINAKLINVSYSSFQFGAINSNRNVSHTFLNASDVSDYISFDIVSPNLSVPIRARTYERISLQKGRNTRVQISKKTMIIKEGESSPLSIRSVLGIGVLKIINQTNATTVSDFKYVATIINEPLKMNAVLELEQMNTVEDYLEFALLKTKAVGTWQVRTKDKISVAKGEEKVFTLTDDTEVVIILKSGVSEPTKIRNVLNIAKLRFFNETSTVLKNIQYEGASGKVDNLNIHGGNEWFFWDYDSTSKHFIFEVQTSDGPVKVKTKESISLFAGKIVTYTSNNDTVVLKDGINEEVQIKHLLGVRTLNVLNRTTATSLKSLKLINEIREEELENNETWTIDFNSEVNDYLEFELLKTKEIGAWRVRTKEKINIPKGQVKDFTLTDDTEVVIVSISGVSEATKISSVLGITELQFFNKTSVVLKNIQYEGESIKVDNLNINEGNGLYLWDYDATPKRFIFEVQTSEGLVKVKTKDKVTLIAGRIIKFTFTNNTVVIKDGTNEEVQIKHLLGMSTLEVLNRTTAQKIENLKFADATWEGVLEASDVWKLEFSGGSEAILEFTVVSTAGKFESKTKDKIIIPRGSLVKFELTNDTEVVAKVGTSSATYKIQNLLDMAELSVINNSSLTLFNVSFAGSNWGDLLEDRLFSYIYFSPPISGVVTFEVRIKSGTVKLQKAVTLNKGENIEIYVRDNTSFYRSDVDKWVTIGSLL